MQISSNYSMNGVPYENRRRQDNIPQFSTERAKQENESINPYMADTDFNEKAFDMIDWSERSAGGKGRMDGSSEGSKCKWSGNKEKWNVEPYITDDGTKAK